MKVPKSIKNHVNLTEEEIKAYYSINPINEDDTNHEKRFSKIINDYLDTKDFKNDNAKYCYKRQLKQMIKDDKTNTPKYKEFDMWILKEIQRHISKQKDWLLEINDKAPMPKKCPKQKTNVDELKQEIENLKKQLQEKDNQIEYLMEENAKLKYNNEIVEETKKEYLISDTSEEEEEEEEEKEEEVIEKPKPKPKQFVIHFDTEEIKEVEFKTADEVEKFYSKLSNDKQRKDHYLNKIKKKQNQLIQKFQKELDCDPNEIDDLVGNEFEEFIDLEANMLETLTDDFDEDELYDKLKQELRDKLNELATDE